ncbi:MAG TPA: hypothetical protein VGD67_08925 [Pseudonocardiaceae bacterium]
MTGDETPPPARPIPAHVVEWSESFGGGLGPVDYLNRDAAVPVVLAAQWLFCPDFAEYEGCVVALLGGGEELSDEERSAVDAWRAHHPGDPAAVEFMVNRLSVPSLFLAVDLQPFEDDLVALARSVARCWRGLLASHFPGRDFTVEVIDEPGAPDDPVLTFYSGPARAGAATIA